MNKPRNKSKKTEAAEQHAPWMVCTFPVDLRLRFVASCMQKKTTVTETLKRLILNELESGAVK